MPFQQRSCGVARQNAFGIQVRPDQQSDTSWYEHLMILWESNCDDILYKNDTFIQNTREKLKNDTVARENDTFSKRTSFGRVKKKTAHIYIYYIYTYVDIYDII